MARIEKSKPFVDTLELSDGEKDLQIEIKLDLNAVAHRYRPCQIALVEAEKLAEQNPNDPACLNAYGEAICSMFQLIFGEVNTEKIMEFYEDDYSTMLLDLMPYLAQTIVPALQAERERKISQAKHARRFLR